MDEALQKKIDRFRGLKEKMPTSELPRWTLAQTYEEADLTTEALAEYEGLVALKPDYCLAWLRLGALRSQRGEIESARAALLEGKRLAVEQGHSAPKAEADKLLGMLDDDDDWPAG
ncbi:MAG TPA: hypothetical protein PK095_15835 [Myxococcota bacterium]|nr:hypothetical protein [Myxococcota bacterium]